MSDLGALLRKAREEQGLSLDDIQEITKIRKRYLEALESGDHSVLPGSFYVRAFVKNYSEAVGLDPEEVLRLYQHEVPSVVAEQAAETSVARPPRRVRSRSSDRFGKIGFNIMMWCFLILIVVVVWVFLINQRQDSPPEKADNTPITEHASPPAETNGASGGGAATSTPDPSVTPTPTPDPTMVTFSRKEGNVDHYDVSPAGNHKVEIKVSGLCWTEVRTESRNGEKLYFDKVEEGTVLSYDLTKPLYINVGRADYAEILVDGVAISDGDRANSKKLQLNPVAAEGEGGESATPPPTP